MPTTPARAARLGETPPRAQLDRQSWIAAAIDVLAEDGVEGLRVETLARRCKVTKGSFYWHFKDRRDLLNAVLDTWRAGRIADIVKQTRAEPGEEVARIHHVIEVYSAARNRRGIRIELALRDWARRDAAASAVVAEVDAVRLDCARKLFVACGLPEQEAASRSMLLYAYVFGQSLMRYEQFADDIRPLKAWIADRIAR
jgi:AcrR family transcriptional regulator